jgi:hypothetical protein
MLMGFILLLTSSALFGIMRAAPAPLTDQSDGHRS